MHFGPDDDITADISAHVGELVAALRAPARADELAGAEQVVAAVAVELRAQASTTSFTPRRSTMFRTALVAKLAVAATGVLGITAAGAAAGALPDTAQARVAGAFSHVGVSVPDPSHHDDQRHSKDVTTTTTEERKPAGAGATTASTEAEQPGVGAGSDTATSDPTTVTTSGQQEDHATEPSNTEVGQHGDQVQHVDNQTPATPDQPQANDGHHGDGQHSADSSSSDNGGSGHAGTSGGGSGPSGGN